MVIIRTWRIHFCNSLHHTNWFNNLFLLLTFIIIFFRTIISLTPRFFLLFRFIYISWISYLVHCIRIVWWTFIISFFPFAWIFSLFLLRVKIVRIWSFYINLSSSFLFWIFSFTLLVIFISGFNFLFRRTIYSIVSSFLFFRFVALALFFIITRIRIFTIYDFLSIFVVLFHLDFL